CEGVKRENSPPRRHEDELGFRAAGQSDAAAKVFELFGALESGKAEKSIEHCLRLVTGSDDANLPYRFSAPSQRSGNIGPNQLRTTTQVLQDSFSFFERSMEQQRAGIRGLELFHVAEDHRLRFQAEPFHSADEAFLAA